MSWLSVLFKKKGQDDQLIERAIALLEERDLEGAAEILDQCRNPNLRTQAKSVRKQIQMVGMTQGAPFAGLMGDAGQFIDRYLQTEIPYLRGFKGR
ncbi:MAG TPA: hypothetical protein PLU30_22465 [Verrucomicrobiae bacterium]|nr:hypothetical protein [Verrucomicrobiae bacterium]